MSTSGNRLAELREARGWHRSRVAAHFNLGEKTVYRWEVEDTPIPSDLIPDLADLLEVEPNYLMGWDRSESSKTGSAA